MQEPAMNEPGGGPPRQLEESLAVLRDTTRTPEERLALATTIQALGYYAQSADYWKAQANRLRKTAITDPLTGLFNRRALMEHGQALQGSRDARFHPRSGAPIAYLTGIVDLDWFKEVNDNLGHAQGDRGLQMAAYALRRSVRYAEDGVYRLGGDEFALLMPLANERAIEKVQVWVPRRFRRHMSEIRSGRERFLPASFRPRAVDRTVAGVLGASFGFSISKGSIIADFSEEVRAADTAMYQAKLRRRYSNRPRIVRL
jgi:diguanylate cyclase (GGDEF)-like protein